MTQRQLRMKDHQESKAVHQTSIRVLIADSDQQFRYNFRNALAKEHDMVLVGECSQVFDVPILCNQLFPDVVVLDLDLFQMDSVEVVFRLNQVFPQINILVLAGQNYPNVLEALRNGASGSLPKNTKIDQIIMALRLIAYGEFYIHPLMLKQVVIEWRKLSQRKAIFNQPPLYRSDLCRESLTYREMEVLRLMAQGKNNRLISQQLIISEKTVKNHVSSILHKLSVRDRTQAVLLAIKYGWVELI